MDRYSRMIAFLKVLLPLMALALLSTLFLLSRNIDPMASIPFAEAEVNKRMRDQQITGPFFSGSTEQGDQISFSAGEIGVADGNGRVTANDVSAQIDLSSGARLVFFADLGEVDIANDISILSGKVLITTSTGYKIKSERLVSAMTSLNIESPNEIIAEGPLGTFSAGSMRLALSEKTKSTQMVFTNAVKLIYDPKIR
jgi:lipopolysaccharide export system protein LptC